MYSNQQSKTTLYELRNNDPTRKQQAGHMPAHCLTLYLRGGHGMIFYYLYLVKVELLLQEPLNALILRFTSDKVILEGYRLRGLFLEFAQRQPDEIFVQDERYVSPGSIGAPAVINATVESTGR